MKLSEPVGPMLEMQVKSSVALCAIAKTFHFLKDPKEKETDEGANGNKSPKAEP